jgi:hypothetical protein
VPIKEKSPHHSIKHLTIYNYHIWGDSSAKRSFAIAFEYHRSGPESLLSRRF